MFHQKAYELWLEKELKTLKFFATMLTRNKRKRLTEQGINCEFLVCYPKPIKLKKNFHSNESKSHLVVETSLVDSSVDDKKLPVKCQGVLIENCEDNETGYSSVPDSTTNDLDLSQVHKPLTDDGDHSQTCYCDFIVLPSTEYVTPSKKIRTERISFRQNIIVEKEAALPLRPESISQDVVEVSSFQPIQLNRNKPKIQVLEILCLPPGTIDPKCPIDIFDRPIDLSMKRHSTESEAASEPLNLSLPKNHFKHTSTPIRQTPSEGYDDEVLLLDASYALLDFSSTCSEFTEYYETPVVNRSQNDEDFCDPIQSPLESAEYLRDEYIRLRVYDILDNPCFRFFGYGTCTRDPCSFRHDLIEATDLQAILEQESITIIETCYAVVHQFDSLFIEYFQLFCIVFGHRQMIETLIRMIRDCEQPKRPVRFYWHIINGLRLCKLNDSVCFTHLIKNSALKSPKSFNMLIWIMVDLEVVLEFRDQLNQLLKHEGFYVSAANLTRLLGVCSRTRDCKLIRIIYEAVERYPAKIKSLLHWSVRPQFIRMESSESY